MPYLTNLADIARGAGLTVVEQAGWKNRGHGPMTDVQIIACHHTAGPKTGDAPSLRVVQDGRSDLAGPLAHFVLARSGVVYVVAAGQCWHTGNTLQPWQSNAHAIGIEAEASGTEPWPAAQMLAYAKLCKALADAFRLPISRVLGHKEICAPVGRKVDPNFDMNEFRALVARADEKEWLDVATKDEVKAAVFEGVLDALKEWGYYRYPEGRNLVDDEKQQTASLIGLQTQIADLLEAVKALKETS